MTALKQICRLCLDLETDEAFENIFGRNRKTAVKVYAITGLQV